MYARERHRNSLRLDEGNEPVFIFLIFWLLNSSVNFSGLISFQGFLKAGGGVEGGCWVGIE